MADIDTMKNNPAYLNDALQAAYLEYLNDFLTVDRFAQYHALPLNVAYEIIEAGKLIHERRTA